MDFYEDLAGRNKVFTRRDQLRRVTLICCHFSRNLAYHRAGRHNGQLKRGGEFWVTVNGNFLDQCILEWCKLFTDTKNRKPGEHRWEKIISDKTHFETEMFRIIDPSQFQTFSKEMTAYRNKFVAHLDNENEGAIPHMNVAKVSASFYHGYVASTDMLQVRICCKYGYVASNEAQPGDLTGLPMDLEQYYKFCDSEAQRIYAS